MSSIQSSKKDQGIREYDEITERVLKFFFEASKEVSIYDFIRVVLPLDISTVRYHFDLLLKDKLIIQTRPGFESSFPEVNSPEMYDLTSLGREYVIKNIVT